METIKTLIHIENNKDWELCMKKVGILRRTAEETERPVSIEILATGDAVLSYRDNPGELEAQAKKENAQLIACHNALARYGINDDSVDKGIQIVPAGILEIACKQSSGFAYIKID